MGWQTLTGSRYALAALAAVLVLAGPAAAQQPPQPRNSTPPTVSGAEPRQDGQTLTASNGSWTTYPQSSVSFRYEWQRCVTSCAAIAGATGQSYTLTSADVGSRVRVRVHGNCNVPTACTESSADSAQTGTVLPDPHNEGLPQISGLARENQLLAASAGFWRSVGSLGFAYQWLRCNRAGDNCSNIPAATGSEYRLKTADANATVRVAVTGRNGRGREATALSAQSAPVVRVSPGTRGPRLLSPFPTVVVAGLVQGAGVRLTEFSVRGPRGAIVSVRCRGRGCPFRRTRRRLRSRRTRIRSLQRTLRAGLVLDVRVTQRGFVGKYTRLRIRRGRAPARLDRCLVPGARRPRRCPRGV